MSGTEKTAPSVTTAPTRTESDPSITESQALQRTLNHSTGETETGSPEECQPANLVKPSSFRFIEKFCPKK